MPKTIHVYNRGAIMRRAWAIARQRREETARRTFDMGARIVGARIIHALTFAECLASTPLDLGGAQKLAWAEARTVNAAPISGALAIVRHGGGLAPLRRFRGRVLPLVLTVAHWIGARFARLAA